MFFSHTSYLPSAAQFMHKVYAWMFAGLTITAAVAYGMFAYPALLVYLLSSKLAFYGILAVQFGLVIYLSASIATMSYQSAVMSFLAYAALMGVTLSPIFLVYTMASIALTFASAACMFGGMALYGYATQTDLSRMGSLLVMALWGLIVASVLNGFFASSGFEYLLSWVGVLIFAGLTAYDIQKLKFLAYQLHQESDAKLTSKIAIMGALQLYLDFINLFLYMLKIMGKKRDR